MKQISEREIPAIFPGVLADWQIRERTKLRKGDPRRLVLRPFSEGFKAPGIISYGLSSYGYDIRLGRDYLIFCDTAAVEVDPKSMAKIRASERFTKMNNVDSCLIPSNSFVLAQSLEYVEIPKDCIAIVLGKSTYARCGINLNMTPLEPGWRGKITIEIANMTRLPARVYSDEGIGQVLFLMGSAACQVDYSNKVGASYQDQTGLTLPKA